jgi:hypothetical protein
MGNLVMDNLAIPIVVAVTLARSMGWVECWLLALAAWSVG